MSLVTVEVRATYATTLVGTVTFTPKEWMASASDNLIYPPEPKTVDVETGAISVQLQTGSSDIDPVYRYQVVETFDNHGHDITRSYEIALPSVPGGSELDLADLQPGGTRAAADVVGPPASGGTFPAAINF